MIYDIKLKKQLNIDHIIQHGVARTTFCLVSSKDKKKKPINKRQISTSILWFKENLRIYLILWALGD